MTCRGPLPFERARTTAEHKTHIYGNVVRMRDTPEYQACDFPRSAPASEQAQRKAISIVGSLDELQTITGIDFADYAHPVAGEPLKPSEMQKLKEIFAELFLPKSKVALAD